MPSRFIITRLSRLRFIPGIWQKSKNIDKGSFLRFPTSFEFSEQNSGLDRKTGQGTDRLVGSGAECERSAPSDLPRRIGKQNPAGGCFGAGSRQCGCLDAAGAFACRKRRRTGRKRRFQSDVREHTDGKYSETAERPVIVKSFRS